MDPDTALMLGLFLVVLAIPSLVSALIDGRLPLIGAALLIGGGASLYFAYATKEGGYTLEEVPIILYTMIGQLLRAIL